MRAELAYRRENPIIFLSNFVGNLMLNHLINKTICHCHNWFLVNWEVLNLHKWSKKILLGTGRESFTKPCLKISCVERHCIQWCYRFRSMDSEVNRSEEILVIISSTLNYLWHGPRFPSKNSLSRTPQEIIQGVGVDERTTFSAYTWK